MRKLLFLLVCIIGGLTISTNAAAIKGDTPHYLATIKIRDYEKLTGKKLSFFNRLGFKIFQHKLRQSMNADGSTAIILAIIFF